MFELLWVTDSCTPGGRMAPCLVLTDPARSADGPQPVAASVMAEAPQAFPASLTEEQLPTATAPIDAADHRDWTYLPGSRPGLSLLELEDVQRTSAMSRLASGLSTQGLPTAPSIMAQEGVLGDLERSAGSQGWQLRCPQQFWIAVLAVPSRPTPRAWWVNGHHLATHVRVVGHEAACTPTFFGANPAIVPRGVSDDDTDGAQRRLPVMPGRALLRQGPPRGGSVGVARRRRAGPVRRHLRVGRRTVARRRSLLLRHQGIDLPLEYDNVQNEANRVHTLWRDLRHDLGFEPLGSPTTRADAEPLPTHRRKAGRRIPDDCCLTAGSFSRRRSKNSC